MKNILFISPDQFGYLSDHYYHAKYLKEYYEVDFLCFDKALPKINEAEIKIHYLNYNLNKPLRNLNYLKYAFKLTKE